MIVSDCKLDPGGKLKPMKAPKSKEKEYDEVKYRTPPALVWIRCRVGTRLFQIV